MGPVRQNPIQRTVSLFICVCIALCTIVAHNIAQNRRDSFPLTLQTITTAPMMSIWGKGGSYIPSSTWIHPVVWPQQTWAENWGSGCDPLEGAGSPSNTMWRGPRPTSSLSFTWIHPTVWPQYTNVTDRTDIQTTVRCGEPFYKRSPNKLFEDTILRNCSIPGISSTTSEKFSLDPHSSSYRLIHYSFTARVTTTVILLTGKGGVRVSRQLQQ